MISLIDLLNQNADPARAQSSMRFFKTGQGQYGEGDVFLGISMPHQRELVKPYYHLNFDELKELITSPVHEHRMCGLLILNRQFEKKLAPREQILAFYLSLVDYINNWDLVDTTAHIIVGASVSETDLSLLTKLATSGHLWSERIAMVATWAFIKKKKIGPTLQIAPLLWHHRHDLIHKAVGWMLREAYKKDPEAIEDFLFEHATSIAPTTMRYACEKMPADKRQYFYGLRKQT